MNTKIKLYDIIRDANQESEIYQIITEIVKPIVLWQYLSVYSPDIDELRKETTTDIFNAVNKLLCLPSTNEDMEHYDITDPVYLIISRIMDQSISFEVFDTLCEMIEILYFSNNTLADKGRIYQEMLKARHEKQVNS